jgi:hypothetical protein
MCYNLIGLLLKEEKMIGKTGQLKKHIAILAVLLLNAATITTAKTIYVDDDNPADFNNIQAAIDDANNGDTITVADGIYRGNGNRDIDFKGKAITLRSDKGPENCIIDCQGGFEDNHRGFYFHTGEDANSVLDGFTITNGDMLDGGGIYCDHSSPVVTHCTFNENHAEIDGAGLYGTNSSLILSNCIFNNNHGGYFGGGIYCINGSPKIKNNTFLNNSAHWGGGIFRSTGMAIITDNVFTGNHADYGGGICCRYGASAIISNCTISGNTAGEGAGILSDSSITTITNNIIIANTTSGCGGGISLSDSAIITNNIIAGNKARDEGGGIYCWFAPAPAITNTTIAGNSAGEGGGIFYDSSSSPIITNSILWGNAPDEILALCEDDIYKITYTDGQGDWPGEGNINADPCFANSDNGDYHLKSKAGRWDPNSQSWVKDNVTSPCIDAGDPHSPIGLEPFPNGGIINMGAYGGTAEASKSYFGDPVCETIVAGDINGDCIVNLKDFAIMAYHWLEQHH